MRGCPFVSRSARATTSCRRFSRWLTVAQRDHRRVRSIGIERRVIGDSRADGRKALQRGLHVDREVRLLTLLVVFRDRELDRFSGCRNDRARHLDAACPSCTSQTFCASSGLPLKRMNSLSAKAQRLQIRSGGNGLCGKVGWRRWRRRRRGVVFRGRKEIGLGQGLDGRIAIHAAMVLVVEVLRGLFDLRLGLGRSELGCPGEKPRCVLQVGRGLLRIRLSQKVGVIESGAALRLRRFRIGFQLIGVGCDGSREVLLVSVILRDSAVEDRRRRRLQFLKSASAMSPDLVALRPVWAWAAALSRIGCASAGLVLVVAWVFSM